MSSLYVFLSLCESVNPCRCLSSNKVVHYRELRFVRSRRPSFTQRYVWFPVKKNVRLCKRYLVTYLVIFTLQDYAKTAQPSPIKCDGKVAHGLLKKSLDFGGSHLRDVRIRVRLGLWLRLGGAQLVM